MRALHYLAAPVNAKGLELQARQRIDHHRFGAAEFTADMGAGKRRSI